MPAKKRTKRCAHCGQPLERSHRLLHLEVCLELSCLTGIFVSIVGHIHVEPNERKRLFEQIERLHKDNR